MMLDQRIKQDICDDSPDSTVTCLQPGPGLGLG